jgi:hypothetical protein
VDYTLDKSEQVFARLVGDERKHASAFEHAATPMQGEILSNGVVTQVNHPFLSSSWEQGVSHVDRHGQLWSGNLRGWVQYRKLIEGENIPG